MVQLCLLLLHCRDHTGQTGTQRWQFLEGDLKRQVFKHTNIWLNIMLIWKRENKLSLVPQYSFLSPGHNLLQTLIWDWFLLVHQANTHPKKITDSIHNWNELEFCYCIILMHLKQAHSHVLCVIPWAGRQGWESGKDGSWQSQAVLCRIR